jgi:glucose-6-phosphate dehydrogenase assembly protein OpcA
LTAAATPAPPGLRPGAVLARVDEELRALWATPPAPGEMAKARACTMNLVVIAATTELADRWVPIVDQVLLGLPARAIVVGLDPDGPEGLEATTSAVCTPGESGGPAVCSERVTLVARGAVCARLASCVSTLCATDVPTALVWLGRVHADDPTFAALARDAGRIVLDAAAGSLASLANVVYWARARAAADRPGVADLAWTRLAPWQELCARMFDEPRLRALAGRVSRVTLVQASPAGVPLGSEGALLLGWLATRLGWKAASLAGKLRLLRPDPVAGEVTVEIVLRAEPARPAPRDALLAIQLEAAGADLSIRGEVAREPGPSDPHGDAAAWRLEVRAGGSPPQMQEQRVRLRADEPARLLERTLHRPPHDAALAEAVAWADELRGEELACG